MSLSFIPARAGGNDTLRGTASMFNEPKTLAELAKTVSAVTGWSRFRDGVLRLSRFMSDPQLWDQVQLVAAVFQQQEMVAFLALPDANRDEMLVWLRELGAGSFPSSLS